MSNLHVNNLTNTGNETHSPYSDVELVSRHMSAALNNMTVNHRVYLLLFSHEEATRSAFFLNVFTRRSVYPRIVLKARVVFSDLKRKQSVVISGRCFLLTSWCVDKIYKDLVCWIPGGSFLCHEGIWHITYINYKITHWYPIWMARLYFLYKCACPFQYFTRWKKMFAYMWHNEKST